MTFHISSPSIAILGRQNVGKSSIFNRLTRTKSALVADFPGLTRDYRLGTFTANNYILSIVDTGGFAYTELNTLNSKVNESTIEIAKLADHLILVVDAVDGYTHLDEAIFDKIQGLNKPFSVFINKAEGKVETELIFEFSELTRKSIYIVSALQNIGLKNAISDLVKKNNLKSTTEKFEYRKKYKITFYGKPNVGKSTLLNKLLGYKRVIESDLPGTTREDLSVEMTSSAISYQLIDTAGLRRKSKVNDGIEKISALRTLHTMYDSDIILLILDVSEKLSFQDLRLFSDISKSNVPFLIIANKIDKIDEELKLKFTQEFERKISFQNLLPVIFVSGKNGEGIAKLKKTLRKLTYSLEKKIKTSDMNEILNNAIKKNPPPMIRGKRAKLRYVHIIKNPNITILIHGNQVENLPENYRRYLSNFFRENLELPNHPLKLVFRSTKNPFAGRKNKLSARQTKKRQRLIKFKNKKKN
ncbi:MAG: ribosome biogenesis GTPase Der [Pseudomonadota bacterium]|nr:ribosome biogenesis GTPase Der [Pseudomonadota bacterium]